MADEKFLQLEEVIFHGRAHKKSSSNELLLYFTCFLL